MAGRPAGDGEVVADEGRARTVGFVGAGQIGEPMVERLLIAGHRVRLYARRAEVRDRLSAAGAELVDQVRDLAAADAVISCLYDDSQMLEVLPEVVAAMDGRTVLISHTTGRPASLCDMDRFSRHGKAAIVDAAFSGTAEAVRDSRLTVYLGGEPEHVATARQVLAAYASPVVTTGERGSALLVKLLNNLLFGAIAQVTLRGLEAASAMGIEERALLDALAAGSGGSAAGRYIAARGGSGPFRSDVTPYLRKDLLACKDSAAELDLDLSALLAAACDGPMPLGDVTTAEKGVVR